MSLFKVNRPLAFLAPFLAPFLASILLAQAPAEVLRRTPPPAGASEVITLSDGTRLVPAGTQVAQAPPVEQRTTIPSQGPNFVASEQGTRTSLDLTQGQGQATGQVQGSTDNAMLASMLKALQTQQADIEDAKRRSVGLDPLNGKRREDGLDVDPEGALVRAKLDPRTGKPRRPASQIAQESGLVMVPAGTVLTIRTITGIQTQLGGTCLAVIDSDVLSAQYDAVAIPKGSKVLGAVQTVAGDAQDRAAVIFRQIVDLNGDQIQLLVPESSTDAIGQAGVTGRVNNHFGKKFGSALVWGLISGMTGSGSKSTGNAGANFGDVVQNNVSGSFAQVGQGYLQQNAAIRPDIEVPPNTQMRIILGNPLYLRPWVQKRPF